MKAKLINFHYLVYFDFDTKHRVSYVDCRKMQKINEDPLIYLAEVYL